VSADVVFDLHGTSPADLLPYLGTESSELHEARQRAEVIRAGLGTYVKVHLAIAEAWARRDWRTLGYGSWDEYLTGEYGEELERLRLPSGERLVAVADFRQRGMSTRAIASALGVGKGTVDRDLARAPGGAPEEITGTDGKTYAATRPSTPDTTDGPAGQPVPATPGGDGWDSRPADRPGPATATDPEASVDGGEGSPTPNDPPAGGAGSGAGVPGNPKCEKCGKPIDAQEARAGYARCDGCDPNGGHVRRLLPDETYGQCQVCHPTQDADPAAPVHLETPPPAGSGEVPAGGSAVQAPGAGRPGQPGTPVPDLPAGAQVVDYGDVHVGNREVRVRAGRLTAGDVPVAWLSIVDGDIESEVLALSPLKLELLIGKLEAAHRALVDDLARFAEAPDRSDDPDVWMATSRRGLPYHQPAAANATACGRSMRTGDQLRMSVATGHYEAKPCPRCWPASEPKEQS